MILVCWKHSDGFFFLMVGWQVFSFEAVTNMDICMQRMLIVTCSKEKVIRVWSYAHLICKVMCRYACITSKQMLEILFPLQNIHLKKVTYYNIINYYSKHNVCGLTETQSKISNMYLGTLYLMCNIKVRD
jgi:hypothetical protein